MTHPDKQAAPVSQQEMEMARTIAKDWDSDGQLFSKRTLARAYLAQAAELERVREALTIHPMQANLNPGAILGVFTHSVHGYKYLQRCKLNSKNIWVNATTGYGEPEGYLEVSAILSAALKKAE